MARKGKRKQTATEPALTPVQTELSPKSEISNSSKRAPADFAFLEPAVAQRLGVSVRKFAPYRSTLVEGRDWVKKGPSYWWTRAGLKTVLLDLGVPLAVVFPEERVVLKPTVLPEAGPWIPATVTAYKLTNDRVILCEVAGKRERVQINPAWRELYRNGMAIEVQKAPSGYWRTIRPVRRGVFKK